MELKKLDMDDIKRRILYGLIILSLLPLITMFYINLKQDKWETDRNFYGKEISEDQLKITQNTYQKYECSSKKITKKKELGNMRYYYRDKNHINFEANEEEYNKYIKDSDIFYVYKPKCQISYHSDNGKLTADFTGKKISFEPGTFNSAELGAGYLHGYYIIYFIFFAILWLPICLDQFLTVDSATKNTVICFEQMFVIVAWIGPFNRIGIILSIITILCLLFFPYKRNPFYDLQKDGIDMMKKDFGSFLDK